MPDPCEICGTQTNSSGQPAGYDGIQQDCPRCGLFRLSGTGVTVIRQITATEEKAKLSAWVRQQNMVGEPPELTSNSIKLHAKAPTPGITERADRLLSFVVRSQTTLRSRFDVADPILIPVTYSQNADEVRYLAQFLEEQEFITFLGSRLAEVTPSGYLRHEQTQSRQVASAQGFVAMWIDGSMQDAYTDGFERGIREAGYDPLRVDTVEHVGKIDDEIIRQIRRSRFVVADFTGQRGGVYFEAGFALGLDLPIIWTCRQDEVEKLHFDIRQFNCIDWTDPGNLATRLQRRVEAVIGVGPRRPIT